MRLHLIAALIGASALALSLNASAATPSALAAPAHSAAPAESAKDPLASYDYADHIFTPVMARHGMVASDDALATRVGVAILRQGGNAIDAAVAVGFTLAVTLPYAGNLGGGGFMLIHDVAAKRDIALDFRETAPASSTKNMFLDKQGNVRPGASLDSHQAIGVPGTVAGLLAASEKYGKLPRAAVLAPAIELARKGFTVTPTLAATFAAEAGKLNRWPATRQIFMKETGATCLPEPCSASAKPAVPLAAGDVLLQPDLAKTLERISAEGARGFYEGDTAEKIATEITRHGGGVSLADLRNYAPVERQPVAGDYRGYHVMSMPPPSSGGVHIIEMLNILERYPLSDYGSGSAQAIHLMAESMKLAYADRAKYLGDPAFVSVPVKGLTSRAYADQLAAKIDARHAAKPDTLHPGNPLPYESDETTHFVVADSQGNAVSTTYTLNLNFGSGITAPGTGVLLNNEMDDFSAKPGVPNAFGLLGGHANAIEAGKRPLSSMSPVIVLRDGQPWLITGSPGGSRIITTVLEAIVNAIDYQLNPAESAAQPRFHDQGHPAELRVEKGFSPDTLRRLTAMGHNVRVRPVMGRIQIIERVAGQYEGSSDPRNPDALTAGY